MSHLFYGVAYYDEYMPEDRLAKDIALMRETGINVVRIAESTWSTLEPEEGQYNFYHIDRVLEAMHEAGIAVIVGTPTYAVPAWLAAKHPDILVTTVAGQQKYGPRQIMDIVNPTFRRYAEKIIRTLMAHVQHHPAIIGWQLDNETKHYDNIGRYMQEGFVRSLQEKYPDLRQLNHDFGLDYWSNRIDRWQDFPPVENTINASLACAFSRYQRQQVTEYLAWQAAIVREYAQPHQFVTHNFDFEWRGYSYGVQPRVDHFAAAQALDIAGVDIYHPSQAHLTGREIAFGGAITRSLKPGQNYFVLETQAQGFAQWTPYPGQLRLQAFSHIASGAAMVSYWHWHSIHNAFETYWKGLLSHDFSRNPTWQEATTIGADFARLSPQLADAAHAVGGGDQHRRQDGEKDQQHFGRLADAEPDHDQRQIGQRRQGAVELDHRIEQMSRQRKHADDDAQRDADDDRRQQRQQHALQAGQQVLRQGGVHVAAGQQLAEPGQHRLRRRQEQRRDQPAGGERPPRQQQAGDAERGPVRRLRLPAAAGRDGRSSGIEAVGHRDQGGWGSGHQAASS